MEANRSRLLGNLIESLPDDTRRIRLLRHLAGQPAPVPIVELTRALDFSPAEGAQVLDEAAKDRLIRIVSGPAGHDAVLTGFGRDVLAQADRPDAAQRTAAL